MGPLLASPPDGRAPWVSRAHVHCLGVDPERTITPFKERRGVNVTAEFSVEPRIHSYAVNPRRMQLLPLSSDAGGPGRPVR